MKAAHPEMYPNREIFEKKITFVGIIKLRPCTNPYHFPNWWKMP